MVSPRSGRYELGDHELSRALAAHHQAVRARRAVEALRDALGRDLSPTLRQLAETQLVGLRKLEHRARALRRDAELKHAPQGELLS